MITSENVNFLEKFKNCLLHEKGMLSYWDIQLFYILNHCINFEICEFMSISKRDWVLCWWYLES